MAGCVRRIRRIYGTGTGINGAANVEAMVDFSTPAPRFSTTAIRQGRGVDGRLFRGRSISPASYRPTSGRVLRRKRPVPWAGYPAIGGHRPYGRAILDLSPENESLARWIKLAQDKVHFQGLPARLLAGLRRSGTGRAGVQRPRRLRRVQAPLVIGESPRLRLGGVAYRETEAMADGSERSPNWPLLNAMVNVASGASWVSIHHGGGVGIGPVDPRRAGDGGRRDTAGRGARSRGC